MGSNIVVPPQAIGGGGPGGAALAQTGEEVRSSLTPGDTVVVTHDPVPLPPDPESGKIFWKVYGKRASNENTAGLSSYAYVEDVNDLATVWTKDSTDKGHFTGVPGARVDTGCLVLYGSGLYEIIVSKTGDGTAFESVAVVSGGSGGSGAVTGIYAMSEYYGALEVTYFPGGYPGTSPVASNGIYSYAVSGTLLSDPIGGEVIDSLQFSARSGFSTVNPRALISLDGGVTWQAYNGASWVAVNLTAADMATDGLQLQLDPWTSVVPLDSAGGAIPSSAWIALGSAAEALGGSLDVRLAVALDIAGDTTTNSAFVAGVTVSWREAGTYEEMPLLVSGGGAVSEGFYSARTATTEVTFTYETGYGSPATSDYCFSVFTEPTGP